MKNYKIEFISLNQPVLIGRFMLIFSRRRIVVTDYSYAKVSDNEGKFVIEFYADEWQAQNLVNQVQRQIDIYESKLILNDN